MSRKPDTPNDDEGIAGNSTTGTIPAGRRFSGNEQLLALEDELATETTLPNRAIPIKYHPMNRDYDDPEEIRQEIEAEASTDQPNKALIGFLNEQL
jgi:hypothetical protein